MTVIVAPGLALLAEKVVLPPYNAVIVWGPIFNPVVLRVKAASPLTSVSLGTRIVPSTSKVTVPAGVAEPVFAVTTAVRFTELPEITGLATETVVVVAVFGAPVPTPPAARSVKALDVSRFRFSNRS
jgi:hypothetical protein